MEKKRLLRGVVLMLILVFVGNAFAANPSYQAAPPTGTYLASGISDLSGPAGLAYVEYWVWDGGNDWYYYTYQIHNTNSETPFLPYIKHLTIANPSGEPYVVTGRSGGYLYDYNNNVPSSDPGVAWSAGSHVSLPTLVDWVAPSVSFIFPGQSSWDDVKFQFASQLPPSMAGLTVRHGDLSTYASGLIAAPGSSTMDQRSPGYWKHQYGTKGKRREADSLPNFQEVIGANSEVFADINRFDLSVGLSLLDPDNCFDMVSKAKRQLFAVWLNIASGKLNYAAEITVDDPNNVEITITISQIITDCETAILNNAADLEYNKDMAEILNHL